jgi:chemotaxis family two-component system sensor histidine kinase/response regulator PixL
VRTGLAEQVNEIIDKLKILIVDDSEDFRTLVTLALKRGGYDVAEAVNGEEALAYLHGNPCPAVIVLDVRMPVMDAWAFRVEQQRDNLFMEVPVVIYSCEPNIARLARELRAAGFVSKTESPQRILEEVKRCCH